MRSIRNGLVVLVLVGVTSIVSWNAVDARSQKDKDKAVQAATVFELYKDRSGEFRFRLKDADGNLLAISGKGYEKKADCQKVIDAIKRDAAKAKVEDQAK
jgi:uncharacterized protein